MSVADRIKAEMIKQKISQNRLAKLAQMSQSGLCSIINGAVSPKENTLQAIANALHVPMSALLDEVTEAQSIEDEAFDIRERLRRDPSYRMLFSAAHNATPEHLKAAAAMLKALEGNADESV